MQQVRAQAQRRGPAAAAEPLTGLARRLLREGIVSRDALTEALRASREQSASLVACLVSTGRGDAGRIAVAAAREFGVPALDLDALEPEPAASGLIPQELLEQYRVLPLMRKAHVCTSASRPSFQALMTRVQDVPAGRTVS